MIFMFIVVRISDSIWNPNNEHSLYKQSSFSGFVLGPVEELLLLGGLIIESEDQCTRFAGFVAAADHQFITQSHLS